MRPFTLTTRNVDAWRSLLLSGEAMPSFRDCKAVSLAGALELLATSVALHNSSDLFNQLEEVAKDGNPWWSTLMTEWYRQGSITETDMHGTRLYEFFRLRAIEDKTSLSFSLFLERFCRTMRTQGFSAKFASALSKVLDEMADNVLQHSGKQADGFSGIAGYHAEEGRASFAVVDVGFGILSTLRASPQWRNLATAREALRAVVAEGASSRVGQGPGEGFKQLFGSLVDRNSIVRLRSGDAALIVADGQNEREGGEMRSPSLVGVQVSVNCAVRKRAEEFEISV